MTKRFSSRTDWDLAETPYAAEVRKIRAAAESTGRDIIDLTASNPTACGFHYDEQAILSPLATAAALLYAPDARGIRSAREAVSAYYSDHGARVDPDLVQLTTSTSEGYSFLFRLLCDPGDEVLVAQPSYPLFDYLADLDDVRLAPYPLFYDHGWHIDLFALEQKISPRTRALLLVHPNNPTGNFTRTEERRRIEEICLRHSLALIVDEVFLDYPIQDQLDSPVARSDRASFTTGEHPVLTFTLSGMSKIAGLPQMKAAWIVAQGTPPDLTAAMARLGMIADTFLSMSAPTQHALPHWLANRHPIQKEIRVRMLANLQQTKAVFPAGGLLEPLAWEGGWNLVLRVPATCDDSLLAAGLLQEWGVVTHPGSFYGMGAFGRLVVSLIVPEAEYLKGIQRLAVAFAHREGVPPKESS